MIKLNEECLRSLMTECADICVEKKITMQELRHPELDSLSPDQLERVCNHVRGVLTSLKRNHNTLCPDRQPAPVPTAVKAPPVGPAPIAPKFAREAVAASRESWRSQLTGSLAAMLLCLAIFVALAVLIYLPRTGTSYDSDVQTHTTRTTPTLSYQPSQTIR